MSITHAPPPPPPPPPPPTRFLSEIYTWSSECKYSPTLGLGHECLRRRQLARARRVDEVRVRADRLREDDALARALVAAARWGSIRACPTLSVRGCRAWREDSTCTRIPAVSPSLSLSFSPTHTHEMYMRWRLALCLSFSARALAATRLVDYARVRQPPSTNCVCRPRASRAAVVAASRRSAAAKTRARAAAALRGASQYRLLAQDYQVCCGGCQVPQRARLYSDKYAQPADGNLHEIYIYIYRSAVRKLTWRKCKFLRAHLQPQGNVARSK